MLLSCGMSFNIALISYSVITSPIVVRFSFNLVTETIPSDTAPSLPVSKAPKAFTKALCAS